MASKMVIFASQMILTASNNFSAQVLFYHVYFITVSIYSPSLSERLRQNQETEWQLRSRSNCIKLQSVNTGIQSF